MINKGAINNNLTRGNKSEIVGWGIPSYESEISIVNVANGFLYETPFVGFLKISRLGSGGVVACKLYKGEDENGSLIANSNGTVNNTLADGSDNNNGVRFILIPVDAKEKYYFVTANIAKFTLSFIPAKGALNA